MAYETVLFEKREHVAILTLNRPERLNAINADLRRDVHAAVDEAHADDDVRALIVTGGGTRLLFEQPISAASFPTNRPPIT